MMDYDVAEELAEILDSILGGQAHLRSLNEHLHLRFPGTVSSVIIFDKASLVPVVFESTGLSDDYVSAFVSYYGAINPWNAHISAARPGAVYKTSETFPSRMFKNSEYFNDFMLKNDVAEAVGIKITASGQEMISFSGVFPSQMVGKEEARLAHTLERVAPKLGQTIGLIRLRAQELDRSVAAAAVAARSPDIAIVLDAALRPVFMNEIAEETLNANGLHDIVKGRLALREPSSAAWLHRQSRAILTAAGVSSSTVCRYRSRHFRLSLTRLPSHDPRIGSADLRCEFLNLLQIRDLSAQPRDLELLLSAPLFRLTFAEQGVAAAIAEGLTVSEIAMSKGVSRETIRAHLKSLFIKFEVSRQSDLVSLLQKLS